MQNWYKTGKQGKCINTCENGRPSPGGTAISACWWQRPQPPLNSSILELAARP